MSRGCIIVVENSPKKKGLRQEKSDKMSRRTGIRIGNRVHLAIASSGWSYLRDRVQEAGAFAMTGVPSINAFPGAEASAGGGIFPFGRSANFLRFSGTLPVGIAEQAYTTCTYLRTKPELEKGIWPPLSMSQAKSLNSETEYCTLCILRTLCIGRACMTD